MKHQILIRRISLQVYIQVYLLVFLVFFFERNTHRVDVSGIGLAKKRLRDGGVNRICYEWHNDCSIPLRFTRYINAKTYWLNYTSLFIQNCNTFNVTFYRHMLIHQDIREHVCNICNKAFKWVRIFLLIVYFLYTTIDK